MSRTRPGSTFIGRRSHVPDTVYRFQPQFSDLDRDGHTDIVFSADSRTSQLFWNNGDGTFTDGTLAAGVGTDKSGMGSALGDYDRDGDLDWFVTAIFDTHVPRRESRQSAVSQQRQSHVYRRDDGGRRAKLRSGQ